MVDVEVGVVVEGDGVEPHVEWSEEANGGARLLEQRVHAQLAERTPLRVPLAPPLGRRSICDPQAFGVHDCAT